MITGHEILRVPPQLSVPSFKENRNRSRTGMRTDHASDHIYEYSTGSEPTFEQTDDVIDVRLAVAMAEEDRVIFSKRLQLRHLVNKRRE